MRGFWGKLKNIKFKRNKDKGKVYQDFDGYSANPYFLRLYTLKVVALTLVITFLFSMMFGGRGKIFQPDDADALVPVEIIGAPIIEIITKVFITAELVANKVMQWRIWLEKMKELYMQGKMFLEHPRITFYVTFLGEEFELSRDMFRKFTVELPTLGIFAINREGFDNAIKSNKYTSPPLAYAHNSSNRSTWKQYVEGYTTVVGGEPVEMDKIKEQDRYKNMDAKAKEHFDTQMAVSRSYFSAAEQAAANGSSFILEAVNTKVKLNEFDPGDIDLGSSYQAQKDTAKLTYYNAMLTAQLVEAVGELNKNIAALISMQALERRETVMKRYLNSW